MKRTSALILGLSVGVGLVGGFITDHVLTSLGRPTLTPQPPLAVLLVLLGVGVLCWAWTIRRAVRAGKRPNPFRAVRAVALAKASSILGALTAGFAGGLALFVYTRPVLPVASVTAAIVATVIAAVVLVVAALVAESFCVLPPDDDATELTEVDDVEPA